MSPARLPQLPSYASGTSDVPLLGETIGDNLDRTVAAGPGREALVDVPTGRRWTYAQLRADVDALALGLLGDGVAKGDRVGIWAPNMPEWTLLQYATAKIGAILVNINPSYRTHELEYVLKQAGISLLVVGPGVQDLQLRGDDRGGPGQLPGPARGGADRVGRVGRPAGGRPRRRSGQQAALLAAGRPRCPRTSRSTSSTPPGPPGSPRARPCPTTTSSTTATSWA